MVSGGTAGARVGAALDELGRAEIQSLLLEGGPRLVGAFLDAGEIDELRVFIAPIMLGGREARAADRRRGRRVDLRSAADAGHRGASRSARTS